MKIIKSLFVLSCLLFLPYVVSASNCPPTVTSECPLCPGQNSPSDPSIWCKKACNQYGSNCNWTGGWNCPNCYFTENSNVKNPKKLADGPQCPSGCECDYPEGCVCNCALTEPVDK